MDKQIRRAAIKFYKSLDRKLTSQAVVSVLNKDGYDVIFFNTPEGDTALKAYGLFEYSKTTDAFTFCNKTKIVFVNEKLTEPDRLRVLLHEAGHIKLGHIDTDDVHQSDNPIMEAEANAFMLEVMSPTSFIPRPAVVVSALLVVLSFVCGYNLHEPKTEPAAPAAVQVQQTAQPYQITNPVI